MIDAFEVILPLEALPEEKYGAVLGLLRQVGDSRAEACVAHVTAEWKKLWNSLPAVARVSEDAMQRHWLEEEVERLLHDFLASFEV